MDIKRINDFMASREWKAMLGELPTGEHTLSFPDLNSIMSCKAVAYSINSDSRALKEGFIYTFNVNKNELSAVVKVEAV